VAQAAVAIPKPQLSTSPVALPDPRGGALVTGAGRGIGLAIARRLAGAGWRLALMARTGAEIQSAAERINEETGPGTALPVPGDVTDPASVGGAVRRAREGFGAVTLLVNAAGGAESAPYERTGAEMLDRMLAVNLKGAHNTISATYPEMTRRRSGTIINVASTAALEGFGYAAAYAASKHALLGLTRSVAKEAARHGVRINALCPGFVDTPLLEKSVEEIVRRTGRTREQAREALGAMNRSGCLIRPEEVAEAALWLLSDDARDLNGEALLVDGGASPWKEGSPLPVNPDSLGPVRGYNNGMIFRPGRTLFVAGQVAWDEHHRIVGGSDFTAQFERALRNVLTVVREAGGGPERVGRLRIYVADREMYLARLREIGQVYRSLMGHHYPAMALVEVKRLLEEGALVEIEAEAIL